MTIRGETTGIGEVGTKSPEQNSELAENITKAVGRLAESGVIAKMLMLKQINPGSDFNLAQSKDGKSVEARFDWNTKEVNTTVSRPSTWKPRRGGGVPNYTVTDIPLYRKTWNEITIGTLLSQNLLTIEVAEKTFERIGGNDKSPKEVIYERIFEEIEWREKEKLMTSIVTALSDPRLLRPGMEPLKLS
ncbi:MAG: hypothetical protein AAB521_00680 [Patescibacteria group bacterium]